MYARFFTCGESNVLSRRDTFKVTIQQSKVIICWLYSRIPLSMFFKIYQTRQVFRFLESLARFKKVRVVFWFRSITSIRKQGEIARTPCIFIGIFRSFSKTSGYSGNYQASWGYYWQFSIIKYVQWESGSWLPNPLEWESTLQNGEQDDASNPIFLAAKQYNSFQKLMNIMRIFTEKS